MAKTRTTQNYYKGIIATLILVVAIMAGALVVKSNSKSPSENVDTQPQVSPQQLIKSTNQYLGQYVGMNESDALKKAQKDNLTARVVRRTPGDPIAVTSDFQSERLNFEVADGRVVNVDLY